MKTYFFNYPVLGFFVGLGIVFFLSCKSSTIPTPKHLSIPVAAPVSIQPPITISYAEAVQFFKNYRKDHQFITSDNMGRDVDTNTNEGYFDLTAGQAADLLNAINASP